MKPDVYTSTEREDHVQEKSKTFFNLKIEMFRCSNSSRKIIMAFYFFPLPGAGHTIDSIEAVRKYVTDFNMSMPSPSLLTLVDSGGLKSSEDH